MSFVIVDDTFLSTNMEFNKSDNSCKDDTIIDSIEAEFNCNKKDDQQQCINNLEYFKNIIIDLHEQNSALTTEIKVLRYDSINKSNMINELISITRMIHGIHGFKEKPIVSNIDADNNDMSSNEVSDVNIGKNNNTSSNNKNSPDGSNGLHKYTQFPVYESIEDTENLNDAEEIVPLPTEILSAVDDTTDDVDYSITTSFNSTKKSPSFTDILADLMSTPTPPSKPKPKETEIDKIINKKKKWPSNTILVTGDSILNNTEEGRLGKKFNVKVWSFSGADIRDMYDYITPLLRKQLAYIILHIGSNDAPNRSPNEILDGTLQLKAHIESVLPNVKVYLSSPIPRYDNVKTGFVIQQLRMKMKDMENVIKNNNVDASCIGRAGLHPNGKGSGRLAMNYISVMRCF